MIADIEISDMIIIIRSHIFSNE